MRQISAYHNTKEDVSKEDILIFQYNLDVKVQKQLQDMFQEGYNTIFCYFPTE